MPTIAVLGTLDTKGDEHAYVATLIRAHGHATLLIDVGTDQPPRVTPDLPREEVARLAGLDLAALTARHDRGECVAAMGGAAAVVLARLAVEGRIDGVISLGGGGGTSIATAGMRALPLGFPKVMVSTLAAGNCAPYVGVKDIVMMPAIVDVQGLNRISRMILARAAGAVCGMVESVSASASASSGARTEGDGDEEGEGEDRPIIVASMFGNTTTCVGHATKQLEAAGFEVLVFHATGTGGRTMESLIESSMVAGVLDVTTTEWADELVGGVLGAGPARLDAAAKTGTPAVVAPGCLDMVNFGAPETVPAKFAGRTFYHHNPQVTLMRTTPAECSELGRILAQKVNSYRGPVTVLLPLKAISIISAAGQPFHLPEADAALFGSIRQHLRAGIPLVEMDCEINDPAFAEACAGALLAHLPASSATRKPM
ncbi:MAG: Tm-1-like ATP-binding domain-containing protein [Chthoniobacteraceae bacterium]